MVARPKHHHSLAEISENLRKLEDLWRAGILTDDEFNSKRAQLLGG